MQPRSRDPAAWDSPLTFTRLTPSDERLLRLFVTREAVAPILSPADLHRRMAPDRRLLALQDTDGEVLCFVNIALTQRFPERLSELLTGPISTDRPRLAVFYSITRVSPRARGRARALLLQAAAHIRAEHPDLEALATLSPAPGLRRWVEELLKLQGHTQVTEMLERVSRQAGAGLLPAGQEATLRKLSRFYLMRKTRRGKPLDPVARFHLGNGATVRDVLVGADCSQSGLRQSLGVMVSYSYSAQPGTPEPLDALEADAFFDALLRGSPQS